MGVSKTTETINIKIKMPNPSQEPPASSKAPNEDLKDMDVLCTFKIKIESHNSEYGSIKDEWPYPNEDQDAKPHSGTLASSKAPNLYLKDMEDPCTFKINIESKNSEYKGIKDPWPLLNQDPDANPQ